MHAAGTTKPAAVERALDLYGGDWDSDGTRSINLPAHVAEALLTERGWVWDVNRWRAPGGLTFWHTSEALQVALTAEVA